MELHKICPDDQNMLVAFAESRVGGRNENQDTYGWKQTKLGYLVTVCDGMGGGPGGKTASSIAVREIIPSVDNANCEEDTADIIRKAVMLANSAIIEEGTRNRLLQGMGSTATLLLLSDRSAFVAYVGDSRVYQIRDKKKVFRTFDHSLVFDMVKQNVITEEQARLSAQSNIITRALGMGPDLEVDIIELPYEKGDRFVLCSDGIHGTMPEKELIERFSSNKSSLPVVLDDIATYVDNLGRNSGGGHDNLTLAIIETKTKSKLRPKMTKLTKKILLGFILILAISVVFNYWQYSASRKANVPALMTTIDSLRSDSVKSQTQIKSLTDSLKKIQSKMNAIKNELDK